MNMAAKVVIIILSLALIRTSQAQSTKCTGYTFANQTLACSPPSLCSGPLNARYCSSPNILEIKSVHSPSRGSSSKSDDSSSAWAIIFPIIMVGCALAWLNFCCNSLKEKLCKLCRKKPRQIPVARYVPPPPRPPPEPRYSPPAPAPAPVAPPPNIYINVYANQDEGSKEDNGQGHVAYVQAPPQPQFPGLDQMHQQPPYNPHAQQ